MLSTKRNNDKHFVSAFNDLRAIALSLQDDTTESPSILDFINNWKQLALNTNRSGNLINLQMLIRLLHSLSGNKGFFLLLKGEIWRYYGILNLMKGNYQETLNYFEERLELLNYEENPESYIEAKLDLAEAFVLLSRLPEAELQLMIALRISTDNGLSFHEAQIYNRLGRLYVEWGQWEKSEFNFKQANLLLQKLYENSFIEQEELKLEEAFALHWSGVTAQRAGNYQEAEVLLWQSLKINYHYRNLIELTEIMIRLGSVYKEIGLLDAALMSLEGSLAISQQLHYVPTLLKTYYNKALYYLENSDYEQALIAARCAVELGLESKQAVWLAQAYLLLGRIYQMLEDKKLALACHLKTTEQYDDSEVNPQWIEIMIGAGDYLLGLKADSNLNQRGLKCYRIAIELIELNRRLEYLAPTLGKMGHAFTKVNGMAGIEDARRCYRLLLQLSGDLDNTVLEPVMAIQLRVEALMGLQRCAALETNHQRAKINSPTTPSVSLVLQH